MKEFKKLIITTSLIVTAGCIAFLCALSALQADPPKELPDELKPAWQIAAEVDDLK